MARERVDSFTEAKELSGEHKRVRPRKSGPDIHAGAAPLHGVAGQNMDGISADFQQLVTAEGELRALLEELGRQRAMAAQLTDPLEDGTSPVTGPMRKAFMQRADVNEGVLGALDQYIQELDAVRTAVVNTLHTYQGVEGEAVNRFGRVSNGEGTY